MVKSTIDRRKEEMAREGRYPIYAANDPQTIVAWTCPACGGDGYFDDEDEHGAFYRNCKRCNGQGGY